MFKGVATALITPLNEDGIDFEGYKNLIESNIAGGVDALVVCGTTGEPATMTQEEVDSVIKFAIETINHRVPVIVGTGSNCTAKAIENTKKAKAFGADCALVVTPYYNKCTQEGLYLHYKAINDACSLPLIAYNVPGRTGVNIQSETAKKICSLNNVIGIKEASGNMDQITKTAELLKDTNAVVFSGDDSLALDILKVGGVGVISVVSNVVPKEMSTMMHAALANDWDTANTINNKLQPLCKGLFVEVNPIPVKYACYKLGICKNILRLPLTPISSEGAKKVDAILQDLHII